MTHLKVLITAPFTEEGQKDLQDLELEVDYRPWLETGKLHLGASLLKYMDESKPDILIVEGDEVKEEVITGSNLKLIGSIRGSPNNISVALATEKKIPVIAAPGRNATAVAELTLTLMLSQARRIVRADRMLQNEFMVDDFGDFAEMYKSTLGFELNGKTVGIIGLGKIGYEVAIRLKTFGVRLLVNDPYAPQERFEELSAESTDLENLLKQSDIVTVHCAPTDETRGLLKAEQFAMMKKSAIFINTARASITDEYALLDALKNRTIAGAGLDVFSMEPVDCDNIFLELENVTVTPHIGGNTRETTERGTEMIVRQIKAFLAGEKPEFCLNPEVFD
ncbi:MAG: NAD(P)-dependent oxidoreductase [Candidatus Thorarchaeota archaeon]